MTQGKHEFIQICKGKLKCADIDHYTVKLSVNGDCSEVLLNRITAIDLVNIFRNFTTIIMMHGCRKQEVHAETQEDATANKKIKR